MTFSKITIIGLGLIGGSLAWALKKSERVGEVVGVDLDKETLEFAQRNKIIDRGYLELSEGIENAEIIVLATHIGLIPKLAKSVASQVAKKTVVTDVGSVKEKIVEEVERVAEVEGVEEVFYFVGGHPIAGTERSGVWAAMPELFLGKKCVLTPTEKTDPNALSKVKILWETVGVEVIYMDSCLHDRVFALVSHLPHAVAYALVNAVASAGGSTESIFDFAGGGLKDYTRIGSSPPDMWRDILLANKENVLEAIAGFEKALGKIKALIEAENAQGLEEEFRKSVRVREKMKK